MLRVPSLGKDLAVGLEGRHRCHVAFFITREWKVNTVHISVFTVFSRRGVNDDTRLHGGTEDLLHALMHLHVKETGLQRPAGMVMDEPYLIRFQLIEGDKGLLDGSRHLAIGAYAQIRGQKWRKQERDSRDWLVS